MRLWKRKTSIRVAKVIRDEEYRVLFEGTRVADGEVVRFYLKGRKGQHLVDALERGSKDHLPTIETTTETTTQDTA